MAALGSALLFVLLCAGAGGASARPVASLPSAVAPAGPRANAERVRVEVYAEGLCPFCIALTRKQLAGLWQHGLDQITELEYIPAGNARFGEDGQITCQHGQKECDLNRAMACAISLAPEQDDWFPFVECIEGKAEEDRNLDVAEASHACAVHAGIVPQRLADCYDGKVGDVLQRRALERTESLVPARQWVPWVLVNGVPLFDAAENVETFICAAYGGYPKPKYCFHPPPPDPSAAAAGKRPLNGCPTRAGLVGAAEARAGAVQAA